VDTGKMIDDFKYAAKRYGVSHFIIDSLMTVSFDGISDKAKFQAQADFVSALTVFAKQFDVHIHLVAHPRKTMYDKDEAGKTDVAGSADITNLCDNVLILHRAPRKDSGAAKKFMADAKLEVKKNREFGTEGSVYLSFDEDTKRFTDQVKTSGIFDGKSAAMGGEDD
jgi:twinkle protein